jgi:methionyl-tRNA formyltransferase
MRIALASNGTMGRALARAIAASGHELVALVRDGRSGSRFERAVDVAVGALGGPLTVEGAALLRGVPLLWLRDQGPAEVARLAALRPDLVLVGNFGLILAPEVLAVAPRGAINVHWSLLPRHRGPSPGVSAILAGDRETGVTVHVVTPRVDGGAILDQIAFPLGPDATSASIYARAVEEAERRIGPLLDRIAREGTGFGAPQDLAAGSYRRRPTLADAELDLSRPAAELDRLVRALVSPLPRTSFRGRPLYVVAARPVAGVAAEPGTIVQVRPRVVVACGRDGLAIDRAYGGWPPLPWPAPWARVGVGDRLGPALPSVEAPVAPG